MTKRADLQPCCSLVLAGIALAAVGLVAAAGPSRADELGSADAIPQADGQSVDSNTGNSLATPTGEVTPPDEIPGRFDITSQLGGLNVDEGFEDRLVSQTTANLVLPSGWGVHADVVGEEREEDALFGAAGLSYRTQHFIPKVRMGTSTDNESIQPEIFAEAQVTYVSDPEDGYLLTPRVSYSEYRNTAEQTGFGFTATKYFDATANRLWIGQAFTNLTYSDPGGNVGYSGGFSLGYGEYDSWTVGLLAEAGISSYDSVLGAGNVDNDFYSLRPYASARVSENVELIGRVEYYNTQVYNAAGAFFGIKFNAPFPAR